MSREDGRITLDEWDDRYEELARGGLKETWYGGPLRRHAEEGGNLRLLRLKYDRSPASLRLWNFLLTEESRLHEARSAGKKIVGAMKDLGTIPVMAFSHPEVVAFYPDGAWWTPCIMEMSDGLLGLADSVGIDESYCPVRGVLGAFLNQARFPIPDLLTCSVGATCDDFSAIAQRLNAMGYAISWWEAPSRRYPDENEDRVVLPGGFVAPQSQVTFVRTELERIRAAIESLTQSPLDDEMMALGIHRANGVRRLLRELRRLTYTAEVCPLPALEMQIAEMLAIHFCSDLNETLMIYEDLLAEVKARVTDGVGVLSGNAVRVFWVNPVADLRVMNVLEDCGGRVCGTEYMFCHAFDEIPEDIPPMEALARTAMADPMVGSSRDRATRICRDISAFGAEAVIVSRIPGASHCAMEGRMIASLIETELNVPVIEIEVPPVCDASLPALRTRIEALIETVRSKT